ncbi:hypothetical protein ABE438_19630 [Bosea sp. TWI1241]|jgi:hypothetical protein|uniref:hypothetical protein n=1 Tax=Bosea sp. TWI1241 TaxID=3148904 RepID=UPI00320AB3C6
MIDENSTPEEIAAYKAKLERELDPVAKELDASSRKQILAAAKAEGWSDSQADWLDKLAKQPLFQAVADGVPGEEALQQAYGIARRKLAAGYFDNALDEGKNLYTAFLTVVDLEKQIAERRGDTPPDYPDAILFEACRAVERAAAEGLSTEDQIATGFGMIRELSARGTN